MSQTRNNGKSAVHPDEQILKIRDTTVTFDMARGESRVLDSADIDIQRGEIFGIVGESGSGKSMFADSILDAVVDPGHTTGEITYYPDDRDPVDILSLSPEELRSVRWEDISMVFQGAMSSFNPVMSVRNHFVETLETHGYDEETGMEHARELLAELYLDPDRVLNSYPHELSGGMKQRALIALSLVLKPEVLVMDEPTAALDLLMQQSIVSLLHKLKERYDLTILFISHDLPQVAGLADRIGVMYAFEFVEIASASRVLESPIHPYTRALVNSVPNLDAPLSEMTSVDGSAPDPINVPTGCSYHPRCPLATEQCRKSDPEMNDVGANHTAACHHWEQVDDEIPIVKTDPSSDAVEPIQGDQSKETMVALDDVEVHFEKSSGLLDIGDSDVVKAVDGIDLDLYEKDVISLVGESGCGKTTLGKTSIGVQRPTDGTVNYRGQDVWDAKDRIGDVSIPFKKIRRSLQIVHQDPGSALNSNRTVKTLLSAPLKKWRPDMDSNERMTRIRNMLEHVGMTPAEDYENRYPHQLSGGEQQRVVLVRTLLMNPDLTLLDEAVSALDVSLRIEMMDLMLEMQDLFDTSYLFISHNFANARYLAGKAGGRIGVMYLGQIVEMGPAEQIVQNPKHPYTKVLKWATANMEGARQAEEPPIRDIDIPDPVDPPSGCSFHTRCPVARDVCTKKEPCLDEESGNGNHGAACFRARDESHEYWDSEPLDGTDDSSFDKTSKDNQSVTLD